MLDEYNELRRRIIENPFVDRIRYLELDKESYSKLCDDLRALSRFWQHQPYIDKDLASELYVLVRITQYATDQMRATKVPLATAVEDMLVELDALVLECFGPGILDKAIQ